MMIKVKRFSSRIFYKDIRLSTTVVELLYKYNIDKQFITIQFQPKYHDNFYRDRGTYIDVINVIRLIETHIKVFRVFKLNMFEFFPIDEKRRRIFIKILKNNKSDIIDFFCVMECGNVRFMIK